MRKQIYICFGVALVCVVTTMVWSRVAAQEKVPVQMQQFRQKADSVSSQSLARAPHAPMSGDEAETLKPHNAQQSQWAYILKSYTHMDETGLVRVDYAKLSHSKIDMQSLDDFIMAQGLRSPSEFSRNVAMAYWANLYNALTVQVVAQNYPVNSIREIKSGLRKGPWRRKLVSVEGRRLSLDNIEQDILRREFKTSLVHYMVNCASIGCPNLRQQPWRAETLDVDLDSAARAYINSPRGVSVGNGRIRVSKIYKWFKVDFGGSKKNILVHLKKYAEPDLRRQLDVRAKIDHYAYDWSINNFQNEAP